MAYTEHLEMLRRGMEVWDKWRSEHKDVRPDLVGAHLFSEDLSRADLIGADLSRADLTGADLSEAHLTDVRLIGANLTRAKLVSASLIGADFTAGAGMEKPHASSSTSCSGPTDIRAVPGTVLRAFMPTLLWHAG